MLCGWELGRGGHLPTSTCTALASGSVPHLLRPPRPRTPPRASLSATPRPPPLNWPEVPSVPDRVLCESPLGPSHAPLRSDTGQSARISSRSSSSAAAAVGTLTPWMSQPRCPRSLQGVGLPELSDRGNDRPPCWEGRRTRQKAGPGVSRAPPPSGQAVTHSLAGAESWLTLPRHAATMATGTVGRP